MTVPPSDPAGTDEPLPESGTPASAAKPTGTAAPTRSRLVRASALMASGSIVSRALGFVRNILMGILFGGTTNAVVNAVDAANFLPNSLWILVGGGVLNAILVPAIVRATERADRGADYISRLMTLVVLAAGGLTLLCIAAVPILVRLTSGDLQGATLTLAIQLGFWMMPQIIFSALYVMCGQLLNAHESFGPYQWAPVMNNLVAIIGAGAFMLVWGTNNFDPAAWTLPMIIALAVVNVGGSAAQVAFLAFYVRRLGLRLRPRWGFRGLGLGKLGRLGLWTIAMLLVAQVGIWATRWATHGAAAAAEHSMAQDQPTVAALYPALSSLTQTYMAFMIPQGIIAVAIVTAAFPSISRAASKGDHAEVLAQYARTSRVLAVPMVLCTVLFIALSAPIMWVITGGTGPVASRSNGLVLSGYMVGLVAFAATYLVKRVFYAYEDARAPLWMQLPNTLISVVAVVPILTFVDPRYAAATAALVSSLGNILGWILGLWLLNRRMRALGAQGATSRRSAAVLVKLLVAGAASLAAGWGLFVLLEDAFWSSKLVAVALGAGVGAVMVGVYALVAWALRVEELRSLTRVLGRRGRRVA
ncbi:murein biosynthesis integral membrane protein MurJ [Brachybacterium huguangmaarense]